MSLNFQSRFTNYEFVKGVKASGFNFTCFKEKVDWDKLAQVNLERVVHDLDISVLQEHISTIVRCDLGELRGIDPGLVKLFRLSQLCLEYCIFCQEQLTFNQEQLQLAHDKTVKELDSAHKELKVKKDELKKEVRKRKKLNHQKENIINSFQCGMCPKAFVSHVFLESHVKRRHQTEETFDKQPGEEELKLRVQLEELKQQLTKEKEAGAAAALAVKEVQLAREEALWAQVEKTQADQRVRHQAELAELTETFQAQLKNTLSSQQWKPPDSQALQSQFEEQLKLVKVQLERQREEEVVRSRQLADEVWKQKLEEVEASHKAERDKLQAQLQEQRAQEQSSLAALQKEKEEAVAAALSANTARTAVLRPTALSPKGSTVDIIGPNSTNAAVPAPSTVDAVVLSPSIPKPASRRNRPDLRGSRSPLLSQSKPFISQPLSPESITREETPPPPPAPRRRLQRSQTVEDKQVKREVMLEETKVKTRTPVTPLISSDTDSQEEIIQSMEEMKATLQQHPDIIRSLRNDVQSHVDVKLAEFGIDADTESLSQAEFSRIAHLLNHQRKLTKKKFREYGHVRREVEHKISDRLVESGVVEETVVEEHNLKPSKVKQQTHGFLARLTHHYHRKNKKSGEAKMFTSTPLKQANVAENPQGILKLSREQLWLGGDVKTGDNLQRTQSAPTAAPTTTSKAVKFASSEQRTTSPSSSSWDHDIDEVNDKPKHQPVNSAAAADAEHKTALSFLASSLPQSSIPGPSGDFVKPAQNPEITSKPKKSSAENDNSWDLEDL